MNDEISEQAADVAKQIWNSANSRRSDYHWDAIDARLQKQMAAKVIYYADKRVRQLVEVGKALNEVLDFKTKTIEEMNVERQRLAACVKERDQRIAELEAAIKVKDEALAVERNYWVNYMPGMKVSAESHLALLNKALGEKTV
jgi:hypothetical protein